MAFKINWHLTLLQTVTTGEKELEKVPWFILSFSANVKTNVDKKIPLTYWNFTPTNKSFTEILWGCCTSVRLLLSQLISRHVSRLLNQNDQQTEKSESGQTLPFCSLVPALCCCGKPSPRQKPVSTQSCNTRAWFLHTDKSSVEAPNPTHSCRSLGSHTWWGRYQNIWHLLPPASRSLVCFLEMRSPAQASIGTRLVVLFWANHEMVPLLYSLKNNRPLDLSTRTKT